MSKSQPKIAVLTTDTFHHTYFVSQLLNNFEVGLVICETESLNPPFEVEHEFEHDRDVYEVGVFFDHIPRRLDDITDVVKIPNINDEVACQKISLFAPDICIVFGTRKLHSSLINSCAGQLLNLHGGDPGRYRGLDTHLWSIYHSEFSSLVSTLHCVDLNLDTGPIVYKYPVPVTPGMKIYELRARNTELCVRMALMAIDEWQRFGIVMTCPQHEYGRYYSFMPACLKQICRKQFERYTDTLDA